MANRYLDISVPLDPEVLVWSGHEPVVFEHITGIHDGAKYKVTRLHIGSHTATHVDAPFHFGVSGSTVDMLSPEVLIGPAEVYDFRGVQAINTRELESRNVGELPRVLIRSDNSGWIRRGPIPDLPSYLTEDAAAYLIKKGVSLIGFDGISIDHPEKASAHLLLLRAGVVIVECLDLSLVSAGRYELICLPLRITGGDGAPARALLRKEE